MVDIRRTVGRLAAVLLVLAGSAASAPPLPATAAASPFVTTAGTRFLLDDRPFYVAGTNNHYLGWGTRAEVDQVLESAATSGYNVVRGIMHSVKGSPDGVTKRHVWNPASTADSSNMGVHGTHLAYWDPARNTYAFNDSTVDGLGRWDYVIYKAGQLGLKLNIAMLDFWQWAGGAQQVSSWYVDDYDGARDPQRYTFFFQDPRAKRFYRDWTAHVLDRVNSLTGVRYRDDPTVFAWDLMNEPEVSSVALAQSWMQEMATHVKARGARQLVGTGSEGFYGGQAGSDPDTEPVNVPAVDFQTWHTYPTYHGVTPAGVLDLVRRHCDSARNGGKPVLMQEFAYPAVTSDERRRRSDIYRSWLAAIQANDDCAGWMYWRLEGRVKAQPTRPHPQDDTADPARFVWPPDNGEHFGINGDTDPAYAMFAAEAARLREKNGPAVVVIDDAVTGDGSGRWTYSEGWTHCTSCEPEPGVEYHENTQSWSAVAGATATLAFTGTRVTYRGVTAGHHGIAAVSVDGGAEVMIDLYRPTKTGDMPLWTSPVLAPGDHTLRVRVTGARNPAAASTEVTLDRVDVSTS
jgi:mannan endo-1,4-beta-mannosidase